MDRRTVKNIVLGLIIGAVMMSIGINFTEDKWNMDGDYLLLGMIGFGLNGMSIAFLIDSGRMYRRNKKNWESKNK